MKALFNLYGLETKADSQDSIEQVGQLSTSTSRGAFLSNMYVRGTLRFQPQVEWRPRVPD